MSNSDDLAAHAAAAAAAGAHSVPSADGPHATLEEIADATMGLPDAATAAEVLDHAELCDTCAALVVELEEVVEILDYTYPAQMPVTVREGLLAALAAEA